MLKPKQKWSRHSYGEILHCRQLRAVSIKNEHGLTWTIGQDIFDREFVVADEYNATAKESRTKIVDVILQSPSVAMTICFRKKPNTADTAKAIAKAGSLSEKAIKKILDSAGEERVMIGRHYSRMNEHGRLQFFDMEANQMKQVDTRTILWAIVKGIRYEAK